MDHFNIRFDFILCLVVHNTLRQNSFGDDEIDEIQINHFFEIIRQFAIAVVSLLKKGYKTQYILNLSNQNRSSPSIVCIIDWIYFKNYNQLPKTKGKKICILGSCSTTSTELRLSGYFMTACFENRKNIPVLIVEIERLLH